MLVILALLSLITLMIIYVEFHYWNFSWMKKDKSDVKWKGWSLLILILIVKVDYQIYWLDTNMACIQSKKRHMIYWDISWKCILKLNKMVQIWNMQLIQTWEIFKYLSLAIIIIELYYFNSFLYYKLFNFSYLKMKRWVMNSC